MLKVTKDLVRRAGISMGVINNAPLENMSEITDPEKVIEVLRKQATLVFEAITTAYIAQRVILDALGVPEDEFVKMSEKYALELVEDASKLDIQKEMQKIVADQTLLN